MIARAKVGDMAAGGAQGTDFGDPARPCKSPVFRLYYQGICLLFAYQSLFFLPRFTCYFAARGAFTGMAPLFMPRSSWRAPPE
jgi:hypothetical protein